MPKENGAGVTASPHTPSGSPGNGGSSCVKCDRPDSADDFVQCDQCDAWLHMSCAGVTPSVEKRPFSCVNCVSGSAHSVVTSSLASSTTRAARAELQLQMLKEQHAVEMRRLEVEKKFIKEKYELLQIQLEEDENRSNHSRISRKESLERVNQWRKECAEQAEGALAHQEAARLKQHDDVLHQNNPAVYESSIVQHSVTPKIKPMKIVPRTFFKQTPLPEDQRKDTSAISKKPDDIDSGNQRKEAGAVLNDKMVDIIPDNQRKDSGAIPNEKPDDVDPGYQRKEDGAVLNDKMTDIVPEDQRNDSGAIPNEKPNDVDLGNQRKEDGAVLNDKMTDIVLEDQRKDTGAKPDDFDSGNQRKDTGASTEEKVEHIVPGDQRKKTGAIPKTKLVMVQQQRNDGADLKANLALKKTTVQSQWNFDNRGEPEKSFPQYRVLKTCWLPPVNRRSQAELRSQAEVRPPAYLMPSTDWEPSMDNRFVQGPSRAELRSPAEVRPPAYLMPSTDREPLMDSRFVLGEKPSRVELRSPAEVRPPAYMMPSADWESSMDSRFVQGEKPSRGNDVAPIPYAQPPGKPLSDPNKSNAAFNQNAHSIHHQLLKQFGITPNYATRSHEAGLIPPGLPTIYENAPSPSQLAARQVMPRDLPSFSGNPADWPIFISSFINSTLACGYSSAENLARLQRCLKGAAYEAVKSRLLLPESIPKVIDTLRLLYGRPELLISTLLEDVRLVPAPRAEKLETLIDFGIAVQGLCDHLEAAGQQAHLSNPTLLMELVDKLPAHVKMEWAGHLQNYPEVNLKTFGDFMTRIVTSACKVTMYSGGSGKVVVKPKQKAFLNAHSSQQLELEDEKLCVGCKKTGHRVPDCEAFKSLDVGSRWRCVQSSGLCRICLNMHGTRGCRNSNICGVNGCQFKHHPLLHSDRRRSSTSTEQSPVTTADAGVHSPEPRTVRGNGVE